MTAERWLVFIHHNHMLCSQKRTSKELSSSVVCEGIPITSLQESQDEGSKDLSAALQWAELLEFQFDESQPPELDIYSWHEVEIHSSCDTKEGWKSSLAAVHRGQRVTGRAEAQKEATQIHWRKLHSSERFSRSLRELHASALLSNVLGERQIPSPIWLSGKGHALIRRTIFRGHALFLICDSEGRADLAYLADKCHENSTTAALSAEVRSLMTNCRAVVLATASPHTLLCGLELLSLISGNLIVPDGPIGPLLSTCLLPFGANRIAIVAGNGRVDAFKDGVGLGLSTQLLKRKRLNQLLLAVTLSDQQFASFQKRCLFSGSCGHFTLPSHLVKQSHFVILEGDWLGNPDRWPKSNQRSILYCPRWHRWEDSETVTTENKVNGRQFERVLLKKGWTLWSDREFGERHQVNPIDLEVGSL